MNLSGNSITGQSVTKQPDGRELKARIKGQINRKKHTLSFIETESIGPSAADSNITCLFDVKLAYKLQNGKFIVSGLFKGKDNLGLPCGDGIMVFEQVDGPNSIFHEDVESKPAVPVKDTFATESVADKNKITEGIDRQIEWHTDKCILEIWDGGVEDGDVVTVKLNNKDILTDYTLVKEKKKLQLSLTGKINTITIVAGDEGTAPPNTAEMLLTDGSEQYKITAFNKRGKTADVILIKK